MFPKVVVLGGMALAAMAGAACAGPAPPPPEPTPNPAPAVEERELSAEERDSLSLLIGDWPWKTNFKKRIVSYSEFLSGGPPPDGIPPIDRPLFVPVAQMDWLELKEPVVGLEIQGDARAYPLQILIWHEIVNDEVGGIPVAVTFCPLCNLALAFDRRVGDNVLDFGTTGLLRYSDLVMWDRQTHSWWQQALGEAVVGDYAGTRLTPLPAAIVSWQAFAQAHPQGMVLSRQTGFSRPYGQNPYVGYDSVDEPFLFVGPKDARLHPMERVAGVSLGGETVAYPFSRLAQERVVHDTVGGRPLVVFFELGTRSALDAQDFTLSREVGAAVVYDPVVEGRQLIFRAADQGFVDDQTGTAWNLLGQGMAGPLAGKKLTPIPHGTHFWFAWAAFAPGAKVYVLSP